MENKDAWPWTPPHAQPVDYSLDQYPVAQKHSDSHICLVQTLRYPNDPAITEMLAEAFYKVMSQVESLNDLVVA